MTNGSETVELRECISNPGFMQQEATRDSLTSTSTSTESTAVGQDPCTEYRQIKPYAGMPKEVLLLYSGQARYRVPRQVLFWLVIACILALLAITIAIVALSPRCLGWWQASPLYQVYPRSFRDSDGDGVGDLRGIAEQLPHFQYLNIKSVWISPIYRSPMIDFGYDVEDFRDIDPVYGTMQDFEELLTQIHNRGLCSDKLL
ncbi:hypothetical protein CRUP_027806 [Coryphaenoides rupestris]|nr:hypothetical protein CRUP_027806 [Coryphaenoides rupestris]